MRHALTEAQCHEVWRRYSAHDKPSMRELAEQFHVSPRAISNAIKRIGKQARPKNFTRFNVDEIRNSWNADKPTDSIAKAHRTTVAALHVHISGWRKQGWDFKRRR